MLFQADVVIPANTASTSPKEVTLQIAHGIITKIMVRPRAGHMALAHLTIYHHEHRIAPSNESMDLHGDFFPIDWEEYYECYQPPYELKLRGWNEDDTYSHTFHVYITILPKKALAGSSIFDAIKSALGISTSRVVSTETKTIDIEE